GLAHRRLTRMIERREVERVYAALAWGHFANSPVDIEAPITRHPTERKRMTVLAGGRHAVTHVRGTARVAQTALPRVTLGTGRTHQVRVHLAHGGHPVLRESSHCCCSGWAVSSAPPRRSGSARSCRGSSPPGFRGRRRSWRGSSTYGAPSSRWWRDGGRCGSQIPPPTVQGGCRGPPCS